MKTGTIEDAMVLTQAVLGERSLSVRDLSTLAKGTILQLDSIAGEPVNLMAAGEVIARGEVVIIDENFGIRVTELVDHGNTP